MTGVCSSSLTKDCDFHFWKEPQLGGQLNQTHYATTRFPWISPLRKVIHTQERMLPPLPNPTADARPGAILGC
jgi:hypothetical protein